MNFFIPRDAFEVEPPRMLTCYAHSGVAGVIITAAALMTRVQLVVERFNTLADFQALVEQGVVDEVAQGIAEQHFMRRKEPLDVILPAVEVGPKRGSA